MCFIDYKKAFDSVPHDVLCFTVLEMGFLADLVNILLKPYNKKAKVSHQNGSRSLKELDKDVYYHHIYSKFLWRLL